MSRFAFIILLCTATMAVAQPKRATAPEVDLEQMAAYPAATFEMGGPDDSKVGPYGDGWFVDQLPAHEVSLSAFHLDRTEVSATWFALFLTHAGGELHYDPKQPIAKQLHSVNEYTVSHIAPVLYERSTIEIQLNVEAGQWYINHTICARQ